MTIVTDRDKMYFLMGFMKYFGEINHDAPDMRDKIVAIIERGRKKFLPTTDPEVILKAWEELEQGKVGEIIIELMTKQMEMDNTRKDFVKDQIKKDL